MLPGSHARAILWGILGEIFGGSWDVCGNSPHRPEGASCAFVCLWAYVSDGEVGLALRWVRPCLYFRSVWWGMAGPILRVCLLLALGSCSLSCARVRGRPAIARVCLPVNLRVRCGVGPALASLLGMGRVTGSASVLNPGGAGGPCLLWRPLLLLRPQRTPCRLSPSQCTRASAIDASCVSACLLALGSRSLSLSFSLTLSL